MVWQCIMILYKASLATREKMIEKSVTMDCKQYQVHAAITVLFQMEFLCWRQIQNDTINDVHKFNDPKLLRNPTTYQPGKYIACCYDKICYNGVILDCSNVNQDMKVKFMIAWKGSNLSWVNDMWSCQCCVPFRKVICEVSPPLAKWQSDQDFVSYTVTIESYD